MSSAQTNRRYVADASLVRLIDISADQAGKETEEWRGTLADFEANNASTIGEAERAEIREQLAVNGIAAIEGFVGVHWMLELVTTHVLSLVPQTLGAENFEALMVRLSRTHTVVTDLTTGDVVWCSAPPSAPTRNVGLTTAVINKMLKGRPEVVAA